MIQKDEHEMTEEEKEDLHQRQEVTAWENQMREILKESGEYPVMSYEKLREINDEVSEIKYALYFVMTFLIIIGLVLIYIAFKL